MIPLHNKMVALILDGISAITIYLGFVNGSDLAIFLGMLASLTAIVNHSSQYLERRKKKREAENSKNESL